MTARDFNQAILDETAHRPWLLLNLPYYPAAMRAESSDDAVFYESRRRADDGEPRFVATYRPTAPPREAAPGSLEYFLTERYCLYHVFRRGSAYRLDIHHPPWPLQPADAEFRANTMARAAGLSLPDAPPILHFSRRQDMVAWPPHLL